MLFFTRHSGKSVNQQLENIKITSSSCITNWVLNVCTVTLYWC